MTTFLNKLKSTFLYYRMQNTESLKFDFLGSSLPATTHDKSSSFNMRISIYIYLIKFLTRASD